MFARIIGSDLILDERHDAPPWNCAPAPAARTVPGIPCHDKVIHPIEFRKEYYVLFPEAKGTRHEINNNNVSRFPDTPARGQGDAADFGKPFFPRSQNSAREPDLNFTRQP